MKLEDLPQSASIGWLREQIKEKGLHVIGTCGKCAFWIPNPNNEHREDDERCTHMYLHSEWKESDGCIHWEEKKK
jgi:hypothetical protein